jgi:S-DNA-T family DNA segregation ATPase FtsK/SpoIIIE
MAREMTAKRHEFIGVLVLTVALLLFVCLVSYDARDSSFNALSYKLRADNMAGKVGAHVSDFLFQLFGYSAYLLLCPLAILSWRLVRGLEIHSPYLRTLGFLLILASTATTLQMLPGKLLSIFRPREVNFVPGGVTGALLADLLLPNLNKTGTAIVVGAAFVLGLLAATTLSLQNAFSRLVREKDPSQPGLWERFRRWRASRKPVRTVVNIKPSGPPPLDLTPRPAPVKPVPPPPVLEMRPATPSQSHEGDWPRPLPPADRSRMRKFNLPLVELLNAPQVQVSAVDEAELMERARRLAEKCAEFDVHGSITQIHPGPVVTTFEFKPDAGVKYARITSLVDDLCLGIKAESIRIDRLPGKATVGIEVPNNQREIILLRELIDSDAFRRSSSKLTLALGKLINGNTYVTELTRMPHLLIAGATGAGKSVALNCMITSVLYKASPEEVRLILIDPKRLELGVYADIPHLLTPIVTDPKEAAAALRWATSEMETRYKKLALRGVRNIDQYNALIRSTGRQLSFLDSNESLGELENPLPYLLIVIDELADLMMVSLREVEESITRLAAMARAVGIHLILATQRPSVDVITGIIKANFPCRIAFKVATKVDSRTIIDSNGAEQLLGNGDMLFMPPGTSRLRRIHGAYVSEKETQAIVEHLRKQGRPSYDDTVLSFGQDEVDEAGNPIDPDTQDSLYNDAVRIVVSEKRASTSLLQRRLSIGYGRAAKLIDMMYQNNLVGPADGSKPREVLVGLDYLERLDMN